MLFVLVAPCDLLGPVGSPHFSVVELPAYLPHSERQPFQPLSRLYPQDVLVVLRVPLAAWCCGYDALVNDLVL